MWLTQYVNLKWDWDSSEALHGFSQESVSKVPAGAGKPEANTSGYFSCLVACNPFRARLEPNRFRMVFTSPSPAKTLSMKGERKNTHAKLFMRLFSHLRHSPPAQILTTGNRGCFEHLISPSSTETQHVQSTRVPAQFQIKAPNDANRLHTQCSPSERSPLTHKTLHSCARTPAATCTQKTFLS